LKIFLTIQFQQLNIYKTKDLL